MSKRTNSNSNPPAEDNGISSRGFMNLSAIAGCSAFAASKMAFAQELVAEAQSASLGRFTNWAAPRTPSTPLA